MLDQIMALKDSDGLTLKKYTAICYKSGWQVADTGVECKTAAEAVQAIEQYNGTCGIWYENGVYYIDHSFRVKTKKKRLKLAISIIKSLF